MDDKELLELMQELKEIDEDLTALDEKQSAHPVYSIR